MIPVMKAKTTALLIDDDNYFLDDLINFLPNTHYFHSTSNPQEAVSMLSDPLASLNKTISINDLTFNEPETIFDKFKGISFNELISVIVVDHRMKPLDGLEVCKKINSKFIKKIMLTSYATKETAIKAFNEKLIDYFILKTNDNLIPELSEAIQRCTSDFFIELSKGIPEFRSTKNHFFSDKFINFFKKYCEKHDIVEYCTFHDLNNIALKNAHGKYGYISIYNNEYLEDILASVQASTASKSILEKIINRKEAPCFANTASPLIPNGNKWNQYMSNLITIDEDIFIAEHN